MGSSPSPLCSSEECTSCRDEVIECIGHQDGGPGDREGNMAIVAALPDNGEWFADIAEREYSSPLMQHSTGQRSTGPGYAGLLSADHLPTVSESYPFGVLSARKDTPGREYYGLPQLLPTSQPISSQRGSSPSSTGETFIYKGILLGSSAPPRDVFAPVARASSPGMFQSPRRASSPRNTDARLASPGKEHAPRRASSPRNTDTRLASPGKAFRSSVDPVSHASSNHSKLDLLSDALIDAVIDDDDSGDDDDDKRCFPTQSPNMHIAQLLQSDRHLLKSHVRECFNEVAKHSKQRLKSHVIDRGGLHSLQKLLSMRLNIPIDTFGNKDADFERFDFSGDGFLNVNETCKIVKSHLLEHCINLGLCPTSSDIKFKALCGPSGGYTIARILGRGGRFGSAMLAKDRGGHEVCIKCFPKSHLRASGMEELMQEFEALKLLHCEVIAGATEMFQDARCYYIVGEVYHGGDFSTLRQRAIAMGVDLTEGWWRTVFGQCFDAIAFMHDQAMIHCDIKEPNFMLKTNNFNEPEVVIIDLGVATCMAQEQKGPSGTPGYMPPETLETLTWFPRGDLFSMGVVLMQMLTDKVPRIDQDGKAHGGIFIEGCASTEEIRAATLTRAPPLQLMPREYPLLTALVSRLLQKKRENRPTARQALSDPWLAERLTFQSKARNSIATRGIAMDIKTLSGSFAKLFADAVHRV